MSRRQPYAHNAAPVSASPENTLDIEPDHASDGLEIVLDDEPQIEIEEPTSHAHSDVANENLKQPLDREDPRPDPTPEPPKASADDEAFSRLKAQLEREKAAREAAQERARQLENDHMSTRERLRAEQERAQAVQREHLEAQEVAITNAISFAESQAASAQREITRALNEGDYEASANAYRALAKAEADLTRLQEGKSAIEVQKKAPLPQRDEPQQQYQQPTSLYERIEAYIRQPQHSPRVQDYLRKNYDDLFRDFDGGAARLHKLLGAHYIAKADGVIEGSDAYFDALDRQMGYKQPEPTQQKAAPPPAPKKQVPPAAPVSRGIQNDAVTGSSITLTPAQVQFCKDSGIAPKEYAKMLLRAKSGAADPTYTGPRFTSDL